MAGETLSCPRVGEISLCKKRTAIMASKEAPETVVMDKDEQKLVQFSFAGDVDRGELDDATLGSPSVEVEDDPSGGNMSTGSPSAVVSGALVQVFVKGVDGESDAALVVGEYLLKVEVSTTSDATPEKYIGRGRIVVQ